MRRLLGRAGADGGGLRAHRSGSGGARVGHAAARRRAAPAAARASSPRSTTGWSWASPPSSCRAPPPPRWRGRSSGCHAPSWRWCRWRGRGRPTASAALVERDPSLALIANLDTGRLWGSSADRRRLPSASRARQRRRPAAGLVGRSLRQPGGRAAGAGRRDRDGARHLPGACRRYPPPAGGAAGGRAGAGRRPRGRGAGVWSHATRGEQLRRDWPVRASASPSGTTEHRTSSEEVEVATETAIGATQVLDGWRAQGIRFVRFELPDMHGTSRAKLVPIERAYGYAESGPEHVRRRGGAGQPLRRGRRHALQRGGRLRRPAAAARPRHGGGGALVRRCRPLDLRLQLGRRHAAGGAAAAGVPPPAGAGAGARLRAADRVRAGVLRAHQGARAAVPGLPDLQRHPQHLRAVHPGAGRAAERLRPAGDHGQLRVRRARSGSCPACPARAWPAPTAASRSRTRSRSWRTCTATRPPS